MRKVAHVISTPEGIGGAEKVMLALVRGGAKRGWEQLILNPFDRRPPDSRLGAEVGGIHAATYAARSTRRVRELPAARSWLRSQLEGFRPDVIQVHLFHALVLTSSLSGRVRKRSVLTHHHGSHFRASGRQLLERVDRRAGARMAGVVAPSHAVRDFLVGDYGYRAETIEVIPNAWEGDPTKAKANIAPLVLICVANFREQKDHQALLRAFASVHARCPDVRLQLVGDGPGRDKAEALASELSVADVVHFLGAVDDVWPLLAKAHLFVLASRYEPFGIAVLEAMASGLPVVASAVGGLPEFVANGRTGMLVEPGQEEALADAIMKVLQLPDRGRGWGEAGRAVAQRFTAERMVEEYFGLYERLISARKEKD